MSSQQIEKAAAAARAPKPHICTSGDPWTPAHGTPAQHPSAVCIYDGGLEQAYERFECPHCRVRFTVEIPQ